MSNNITENKTESGDISSRHKLERKELQAKITNLKHSIAKGDKKKKREITEQIAKLEAELDLRHEQELNDVGFQNGYAGDSKTDLSESLSSLSTNDMIVSDLHAQNDQPKMSKAQKRRDKKAEQNRERSLRIAEQDELNVTGVRNVELQKIKLILKQKKLSIHEVPSNGDCLYAAIGHQLELFGIQETVQSLRRHTAQLMREKASDFMPFTCELDSGEPFTEEKYEKYCNDIESTTTWGGQLELRAASQFLERPIEVIQGEGPIIIIGEEYPKTSLNLTFHRHIYGLGEHYNSTIEQQTEPADDVFS